MGRPHFFFLFKPPWLTEAEVTPPGGTPPGEPVYSPLEGNPSDGRGTCTLETFRWPRYMYLLHQRESLPMAEVHVPLPSEGNLPLAEVHVPLPLEGNLLLAEVHVPRPLEGNPSNGLYTGLAV
jgi:hypothetical protein